MSGYSSSYLHGLTAGTLRRLLDCVPDTVKVSVPSLCRQRGEFIDADHVFVDLKEGYVSIDGDIAEAAPDTDRVATLEAENAELQATVDRYEASPTVETCRQMIEAQAVKENHDLYARLAAANAAICKLRAALEYHRDVNTSDLQAYQLRDEALAFVVKEVPDA